MPKAPKQRRNRVRAAQVRALAEEKGVGVRAAQKRMKAKADAEGRDDDIPPPTPSRPIASTADFDALPEPEQMMIIHWRLWDDSRRRWELLAARSNADAVTLAEVGLAIAKMRQEYIKARADWEDYCRQQKITISADELDAVREKYWMPFIALLQNAPMEVSATCSHEIRDEVMEKVMEWLVNRVQPQSDRLLDSLEVMTA